MVYVSARALEEELKHLEEELAAARSLEHSTAERHAEEGSQETEAVLEARKIQAKHLEAEREGLVAELRRRAVAEAGWEYDDAWGAGPTARRCALRCGRAGSSASVPTPCCPSAATSSTTARRGRWRGLGVPSPSRASEILAEHGVEWEGSSSPTRSRPCPRGRRDTRRGVRTVLVAPFSPAGNRYALAEARAPPATLRERQAMCYAQRRTRPRARGAQVLRSSPCGDLRSSSDGLLGRTLTRIPSKLSV